MNCKEVFEKIDQLQPEYLRFWEEICMIESPTSFKEGVDAVGRFCAEAAEKYGWQVTVHNEEISGDAVCITMNPDSSEKAVCFSGHMDTVHPVGSFGTHPVHKDDTYLYGPGAKDCKGGIVASFLAMAAMAECGFTRRPVKLILQSDEETSSAGSEKRTVAFMAEMANGCAAFLNTEGYSRHSATMRRKGILRYRFEITGKANHSARCFNAVSAIREAAHKIVELEKWKDKDGLTFNCGMVSGGTALNVVPEKCSFSVDIRFLTTEQMREAEAFVTKIAETSFVEGSSCQVTLMSKRVAMDEKEENFALLTRMNEIYAQVGLPQLEAKTAVGGSDASDMTSRGIVCADSLGVVGDGTHSTEERAEIASLAECAKRLAAVAVCL